MTRAPSTLMDPKVVMAGHSRLQDGVASLAYVPAIHVFLAFIKGVDARHKAGHDEGWVGASQLKTAPGAAP